ncbi:MAG TPA: ethylbenzene dehydrogenase-related protein [Candidatus Obscuribacterales bacterium]
MKEKKLLQTFLISCLCLTGLMTAPSLKTGSGNAKAKSGASTAERISGPLLATSNLRKPATVGAASSPSSQGNIEVIEAGAKPDEVLNPLSKLWAPAPQATIPLEAQNIVTPHGGGSVKAVAVKGLRLQSGVAFHFEWKDESKDNDTVHQTKFRDAVAIQFPVGTTRDTTLAMGCPHGPVNIWQWKADWEPDAPRMNDAPYANEADSPTPTLPGLIYRRLHVDSAKEPNTAQGRGGPASGVYNLFPQSAHKSPVENMIAVGISSVTTKPERFQTLKGRGIWQAGRWQVVIYKPHEPHSVQAKDETAPEFKPGESMNVAIAVWNGSRQDRNGMKSVSNWTTLKVR